MDMQMPVMDGLSATRALREIEAAYPARPRAPVIMLSANAMAEHQEQATQAGADLHLAKPVTAEALTAAVRRALGGRAVQPD
ncbi:response regulator [Brevundimonas phoenicis]